MRKGQKHTEKSKQKMSETKKGFQTSEETKEKMRKSHKGRKLSKKFKQEIRERQIGKNNTNWKGGYSKKDIPVYNTYAHQIDWCEEVRRNKDDENILEVKCFKCNEWYIPKLWAIRNRIQVLKVM